VFIGLWGNEYILSNLLKYIKNKADASTEFQLQLKLKYDNND